MKARRLWLPLLLAGLVLGLAALALLRPPERTIRSALIGRPLPAFDLPRGVPEKPALSSADMARGQPRLLNIFASWCVPCAIESPQLMALKRAGVRIDAIAVRDRPEDLAGFLARYGDPFARIGRDDASQVQLALGSAGVPETFVIDGKGVIRHQHVGVISASDVPDLLAALEAAR